MYPLRILHRKITIIFSYIQQFKQKNAKLLIFQSISIFQRSLLARQAERCVQRSCFFRLKVRGERLKARSFYRFALNYFYIVARRAGGAIVVIVALAGLVVLGAGARYILLKKTEKHTICSMRKTIFNKKCSVRNTLFVQKCCVYKTFFVILQRISLFNQQSEQL